MHGEQRFEALAQSGIPVAGTIQEGGALGAVSRAAA